MSDPATTPHDVLEFWFGAPGDPPLSRSEAWFTKSDAFDAEVRSRFGATLDRASRGELDGWRATPEGRLALVVVLDQLSRNAYRGDARSFANDPRARGVAEQAIAEGDLDALPPVQAGFLLMPLMHAEDADLQHRCIAGFEKLRARGGPELASYFDNSLDYARRHAEIVERFGRFPHRNAVLGRETTSEEAEFLKEPRSSF